MHLTNSTAHDAATNDAAFQLLQQRFTQNYRNIFQNDAAEKTVLIVPSLTLDEAMLRTIKGVAHYEERMLCMLMLLRMPATRVIYVTSVPIDSDIVDYYLHMLPGISLEDARKRLTMLSCHDASRVPLTSKILARPRLMNRILHHISNHELAHMACFNVTEQERTLALRLNIPLYGADPSLLYYGTKSGSRKLFKQVGVPTPAGFEDIPDENGIITALVQLKKDKPALNKAVVKMNDGFSGEGNAIFRYRELDADDPNITQQIAARLRDELSMVAQQLTYDDFLNKFTSMGGIVEAFVEGEQVASPSVQCRITPLGEVDIISTHDQLLGGESGQIFLGACFPAQPDFCNDIAQIGRAVSAEMQRQGVLGRLAIDFLSTCKDNVWTHHAIEINLRKGGTTHPFLMLQFLTGGEYHCDEGVYKMPNGKQRCYVSSDNVCSEQYKGLIPHDIVNIAISNKLFFDHATKTGVMFHMIGAVSQYGKLGIVSIAETVEKAKEYFDKTIEVLDRESMQS